MIQPEPRTLAAIFLALLMGGGAAWCGPAPRAELVSVSGTVTVQRGGHGDWTPAVMPTHRSLYPGDHVRTGHRAGAVIVIDGARVALGPRTHVVVPAPAPPRRAPAGRIWAVAGRVFLWLIGTQRLEVGTEGAVAAAEGTKFVIEVEPDGATTVTVLEGQVSFSNRLGAVVVGEGMQSMATPTSAPTRPMRVDVSGFIEWEASLEGLWLGFEMRFNPSESHQRLVELSEEAGHEAEAAPDDAGAQVRAGDLHQDAGDLSAAERFYRRALELAPGDAEAQLRLGLNLLTRARWAEAEAVFAAAPEGVEALVGRAAALTASGREADLEQAQGLLDRALAQAPEAVLGHIVSGIVATRRGEAEGARAAFARAVQLDPAAYQAHAHLALVELAEGHTEGAMAAARRAVELAPGSALARESLATVHFFAGEPDAARREADLALQINPSSAGALLVSADIHVAEGDLREGLRRAQGAVALDPLLAPAHHALGMIYLAQNDLAQAQRSFARAVELSPRLVAARTGLGVTYARRGRLGTAMEAHKAAIALDSGHAATLNNIGSIHLARGRLDEAVEHFKDASAAQPGWAMPHANLAIAYLELNRFADAVREGELAVRLGEDSARVHTTLARVYLEQNRTNKAWASLRRALELDDDYALAHLHMAEVYQRMGLSREALNEQLRGITLQPSAMLQTREYSRTELEVTGSEAGFGVGVKQDGRGDAGQNSFYVALSRLEDDWDRSHSDFRSTTALGIAGRQEEADRTHAVYLSARRDDRDQPGMLVGGAPEAPDYRREFRGHEAHYLGRRRFADEAQVTLKLGYREAVLRDLNPDGILRDTRPFPELRTKLDGPLAEARVDWRPSEGRTVVAGVALSGESRGLSGVLAAPGPHDAAATVTRTPFSDQASRDAATVYLDVEARLGERDRALVGSRLATREGMRPVARPRVSLRRDLDGRSTLVALTRPVLRDDVSELSPVDYWAVRDAVSPLDLAFGGYAQSYELQWQLMPPDGSLLRVCAFQRDLRNYVVYLDDPAWAAGKAGAVLAAGTLRGAEVEWERWLSRDLSGGVRLRYTDARNDEAGERRVPYQPRLRGQVRLDYLDRTGLRIGAEWVHIGSRWADTAGLTRLGSYGVMNLRAARQLDLKTDVFVTVENLLDADREFWRGYPERGRRVQGGVEYRF